jgi:hypothetical protein
LTPGLRQRRLQLNAGHWKLAGEEPLQIFQNLYLGSILKNLFSLVNRFSAEISCDVFPMKISWKVILQGKGIKN